MENVINDISNLVKNGLKVDDADVPAILVNGDYDIKSLEHLQNTPARIKQRVGLSTEKSFVDYVNKFKVDGTVIFTDLEETTIQAVFDYHENPESPKWGEHIAIYNCPFSKDWKEWRRKDKNAMNQIEFGVFLENNIHCIASTDNVVSGTELLALVLEFEETRQSEFKSVQRLQDGTMQFTYTDEKKGGGKKRLPEEIVLGIQPFHNGDYYQLRARVRYRIKDGSLSLWYELINPEKIIEDAFNTVVEKIKSATSGVDFYEGVII